MSEISNANQIANPPESSDPGHRVVRLIAIRRDPTSMPASTPRAAADHLTIPLEIGPIHLLENVLKLPMSQSENRSDPLPNPDNLPSMLHFFAPLNAETSPLLESHNPSFAAATTHLLASAFVLHKSPCPHRARPVPPSIELRLICHTRSAQSIPSSAQDVRSGQLRAAPANRQMFSIHLSPQT